jgi:hypothetical protein
MKNLEINSGNQSEIQDLKTAFEERNQVTWDHPVERYGFGCKNIDEVKTHIRYGQITDDDCPPIFSVK